jgi:small multidrug resistance pump
MLQKGLVMFAAFTLLLLAIGTEVAATSSLPRTEGFRNPLWTAAVLGGYALSIWLLAVVVRTMSVSVAYALWSGIGTAAIAVIGVLFLGERWDAVTAGALSLIIVGVIVLNLHTAH